jgi:tetratricopeptide (TPR) repeat protein
MRQIRRFYIPSATLPFLFIFFLPALAQDKLPEIIEKIAPTTVVILTYDKDGKNMGQGSGFFISQSGDVITNKHVLAGANRAEAKTAEGKVYPITLIVAEDKDADLIRVSVRIPAESVRPLSVGSSIPRVGERVVVIGTPFGLERTVSDGIISAVREIPAFGKIYQITAPISPGSSGSPVVNMKGEVIGIVTFQVIEGQNLNFAIPGERITKLKTEKGKTYTQWRIEQTKELSDSAKDFYDKGLVFVFAGDCEKALLYFERAVKKDPRNAGAYFYIGLCSSKLGRYTEAIDAYKLAIRIQPDADEAYCNLGATYGKLGRYTEAIDAFKQAVRFKPDDEVAHFNLGIVYGDLGRYTEAIDAYKLAIHFKPDYADAHLNLGNAYGDLGRYTEAIDAYKLAIRFKPDDAEAHNNLGIAYRDLGRYTEAIDAYKLAIRFKPDLAEPHNNLGMTYDRLGHYTEAIDAYKLAIHFRPDYADAHFGLGTSYLRMGDKGSALDQYKILKNLNRNMANELFNLIYK